MRPDAPQRRHDPREVFNALRWMVRAGVAVAFPADELPALGSGLPAVAAVDGSRVLRRHGPRPAGDAALARRARRRPHAVILDSRTRPEHPGERGRGGSDGHKKRKGSKVHLAVDTLGHLLALRVTPANAQDRDQVAALAEAVQAATGESVEVAFVDAAYTGPNPAASAAERGIPLEVVRLPAAKRGFVLLPRRWVVERSFAWASRLPPPRP